MDLILGTVLFLLVGATPPPETPAASPPGRPIATEEDFIRYTYAKLAFLNSRAQSWLAADQGTALDPGALLSFKISDLVCGPIADIEQQSCDRLLTPPSGSALRFRTLTHSQNGEPRGVGYEARWIEIPESEPTDFRRLNVAAALDVLRPELGEIHRYCAYRVRLRFGGKGRAYRAMLLLDAPLFSAGETRARFVDLVAGFQGELGEAAAEGRPVLREGPGLSASVAGNTREPNRADILRRGGVSAVEREEVLCVADVCCDGGGRCCHVGLGHCDETSCEFDARACLSNGKGGSR